MTQTWVPGYFGTLTLDSKDLTVVTNVYSVQWSGTELAKAMMGSQFRNTSKGQITCRGSSSGSVSTEKIADIVALIEDAEPLAAALQLGESAGTTDAGDLAGSVVVIAGSLDNQADGELEYSLEWVFNGAVTYTAA